MYVFKYFVNRCFIKNEFLIKLSEGNRDSWLKSYFGLILPIFEQNLKSKMYFNCKFSAKSEFFINILYFYSYLRFYADYKHDYKIVKISPKNANNF